MAARKKTEDAIVGTGLLIYEWLPIACTGGWTRVSWSCAENHFRCWHLVLGKQSSKPFVCHMGMGRIRQWKLCATPNDRNLVDWPEGEVVVRDSYDPSH